VNDDAYEKFYQMQEDAVQAAIRRRGRRLDSEEQGKFNLLSAQINELHVCTVEALNRDSSLDIADVITAHAHAITKLICDLDFDAAAASAERAERLLVEAKRRKGSS
jgi:hypothetical protein